MKILILVRSLTAGGEQRVASLWATGFVNRGHDVALLLGCSKTLQQSYNVPTNTRIYHLYNIFAHYLYKSLGIKWYYIKGIKKIVTEFNPDVIISLYHPWTEWSKIATQKSRILIVSTEHTTFERPNSAKMTSKTYKYKYEDNKQFDYVTVLTEADKKCLQGHLDKVMVMPNPLAYNPASEIPEKMNIILAVGQLHSWHSKGFDILIKAWGGIAKHYPDWRLEIAGGDRNDSKAYLQSIANEYGIGGQIVFLGFQNDMLPYYQRSSIFVLSSRYEGFGMSLIEAMSQGCACIACDYKGRQSEIITSKTMGMTCLPEDIEALSMALSQMIENSIYRESIRKNAIERSKFYSLDNVMKRWDDIFRKLDNIS